MGSQNSKDAGDALPQSSTVLADASRVGKERGKHRFMHRWQMNHYSSLPKNHTGTMLLTQSSEWGALLLILLDKKTFFSLWEKRSAISTTMKIQPEFRWSDSIKMDLLLETEEPSF